jgi:hypothetical protein
MNRLKAGEDRMKENSSKKSERERERKKERDRPEALRFDRLLHKTKRIAAGCCDVSPRIAWEWVETCSNGGNLSVLAFQACKVVSKQSFNTNEIKPVQNMGNNKKNKWNRPVGMCRRQFLSHGRIFSILAFHSTLPADFTPKKYSEKFKN